MKYQRIISAIKLLSFSIITTLTQMGGCTRCDDSPSACASNEMCVYASTDSGGKGWYCIEQTVIAEKGGAGQYDVRRAPASVSVGIGLTGPNISVTVPVGGSQ